MSDNDDNVSRRYRELGREEPAAALDDAILASSRRAVGARPGNRWAGPVSIAAVLVLGIGVSLNMQMEKPGIETSEPTPSASAEYSVIPPPAADAAVTTAQAPERARANKEAPTAQAPAPAASENRAAQAPAELAKRQDKLQSLQRAESKALADSSAPSSVYEEPAVLASQAPIPAAPPAVAAASAPQARMAPAPASVTFSVPSPAPPPPAAAAPAQAMDLSAPRAKREAQGAASDAASARKADSSARDSREVELERIARLRAENRHEEADKALTEFRRINPDYRIPEALWERVKAR